MCGFYSDFARTLLYFGLSCLALKRVNFTNILQAAFGRKDPTSAKKDTDDLIVFFCFWYLRLLKLRVNMLVKLTTDRPHANNLKKNE